jgi:hypothetical protein
MELGDFVKAIAAEVGRPIAIVTQAQLLQSSRRRRRVTTVDETRDDGGRRDS